MEKKQVPAIRFQGFTDAWEQRKLGELGSLKNGMNFSKEAMGVGFPFVNLQNIFGNNVINVSNLGKAMASDSQLKDYNLLNGDVLFVRSSVKLEGVGEAALVPQTFEYTTYSGFIIRFRDEYGLDNNFKRFVFGIESVRNQIMSQATNSANKNISQSVLENLELAIPRKLEQQKIGAYFSNLDHLITLHQRKYEKLLKVKKSMLEKMFPRDGADVPEIRFDGFTDAWEQRKVGDFLTISKIPGHTGVDAKKLTVKLWGKGITEKTDIFGGSENTQYYVRHTGQFMYGKLDFLHAAFGIVPKNLDNYESTLDSPAFDLHGIDGQFLLERVTQENFYLHNGMIANGSRKAKRIHEDIFLNMDLRVPTFDEQKQIGDLFQNLNRLITLHQRKLEKLKNIKKSLLEKMFV